MNSKLPLTPTQVSEGILFLYGVDKNSDKFKKGIAKIKDIVTKKELEGVVSDLVLLIKGDSINPGYNGAFKRYNKFYSGMDNKQLIEYYRFLCGTFGVKPTIPFGMDKPKEHIYKSFQQL